MKSGCECGGKRSDVRMSLKQRERKGEKACMDFGG
jgi:hypothetical protein